MVLNQRQASRKRLQDYATKTLSQMTPDHFKYQFRLQRSTFDNLLNSIRPTYDHRFGRQRIPLEQAVLIFLRYLGSLETYNTLSVMFDVPISVAFNVVHRITDIVVAALSKKTIKWPRSEAALSIASRYQGRHNWLPADLIGAIDARGAHPKQKQRTQLNHE